MGINAPLTSRVLVDWKHTTSLDSPTGGVAAGTEFIIHQENVQILKGHSYLMQISASGFINYAQGSRCRYYLSLEHTNNFFAIQEFGPHRNGFVGFGSAPVSLWAIYPKAANDATWPVFFGFWAEAVWHDWVLQSNCVHRMSVIDLGIGV